MIVLLGLVRRRSFVKGRGCAGGCPAPIHAGEQMQTADNAEDAFVHGVLPDVLGHQGPAFALGMRGAENGRCGAAVEGDE